MKKDKFLLILQIEALTRDRKNNRTLAGKIVADGLKIDDVSFYEKDMELYEYVYMFIEYEYGEIDKPNWLKWLPKNS